MKYYLPFGDWSDDGHGYWKQVLIDGDKDTILKAEKAISDEYGDSFWRGFADEYQKPTLSKLVWEALIRVNYPIERLVQFDEWNDWEGVPDLKTAFKIDADAHFNIDVIIDMYIWLMNVYGANIKVCSEIPMLYTKAPGYGCWE